jgi:1-acyl-sn-glycerol-3-phosphate acyltransferase
MNRNRWHGATATGGAWRDPWRWILAPWTLLVFFPLVLLTTCFWGVAALVLAIASQRAAFYSGVAWARGLCWASFVGVRVEGREHARPGQSYVILSNHQGNFDILALYGYLGRQFRWVMKQELRKVPFLGPACAAIGHVFVDRRDAQRAIASLEAAKPRLAGGVSVLFFPEGTRSADGRLLPFKKGGFVMARQLGFPILPVTISGSHRILPKGCLFPRPGWLTVRFHPAVDTAQFATDGELVAAVRATIASGLPGERSA